MLDAGFAHKMRGAQVKDALHAPVQLCRRKTGNHGQVSDAQRAIEVFADVFGHLRHASQLRIALARSAQVPGNGGESEDFSFAIVQWNLCREIPTRLAVAVGDEFQFVIDLSAGEDVEVLLPIGFRIGGSEKIFRHFSDQLSRVLESDSCGESLICGAIAAIRVLQAKHHIRQYREQALTEAGRIDSRDEVGVDRHDRNEAVTGSLWQETNARHPFLTGGNASCGGFGQDRRVKLMAMTSAKDQIDSCRRSVPADSELPALAIQLAAKLLEDATAGQRPAEKAKARQMSALMDDPAGKAFTFAMADQVFRPPGTAREAKRFRDLISDYGVPSYLPPLEQTAMKLGSIASAIAPGIVMPLLEAGMRRESAAVILPAEDEKLRPHLVTRRQEGMRMNLNQLGEAVLGEEEAGHRLEMNLARLAQPEVDYISVKISAIFSQIHLVAVEETLEAIKDRLRLLYRAAMAGGKRKFVNLDMEEYRDLRLTCDAFRQVLGEPEFSSLEAGIVLQAYLPDAWPVQKELNAWAIRRVDEGGARIKIRIVKGANLAMESVDAEIHDWPLAPYGSKREVDANFKRMLHEGCKPENARAVRLGVASHNLFDIAYALLLRAREGVDDSVEFEMLEGMANHQARVVQKAADGLLLYAPVVKREDFHSAIAYLVRRLDENTSPENFLHDLFGMTQGDSRWEHQKSRFLDACKIAETVHAGPQRVQHRAADVLQKQEFSTPFHNVADTDWSLPHNVEWIRAKVDALRDSKIQDVPLQIGGAFVSGETDTPAADPSRPGVEAYRHALAGFSQVAEALDAAVAARVAWQEAGFAARGELMFAAGVKIEESRGDLIAAMVLDAGKSVMEADAEISEAIDFANYYARGISEEWTDGTSFTPFGTVLVTSPWNFPLAIPCGGILAALIAGNTVIYKPAPEVVLTGWKLANLLWNAGIPKDVLQFVPCPDNEIGKSLVTDSRVGAVVLTGSSETARMFLSWKPELRLFAETSGKNALVIMDAADPDLAVKDLVKSAFGHAGQKCSAASLAILEAGVYDDPGFRRRLKDAAASLAVGGSWKYTSFVTPLVQKPGESLERALTHLDPGEEWLLKPEIVDQNQGLWSPGIKLGVKPNSWFRRTECFGPVLGLVRADDLAHAIRIQNDSDFGLTGGIHSLDPEEIATWRETVEIGNAYINRPITGAIVQRQPFGGWKRSCFGPGAKAGGPNYVSQFGTWSDREIPSSRSMPGERSAQLLASLGFAGGEKDRLAAAAGSDAFWMSSYFSKEHDPSGLKCETNVFRYRPFQKVLVRASEDTTDLELGRILLAAVASGAGVEVSLPEGKVFSGWKGKTFHEDEAVLCQRLAGSGYGLLRAPGCSADVMTAAANAGVRLVASQPVCNGRIELLPYFREQAISETVHRHGAVLPKPHEVR